MNIKYKRSKKTPRPKVSENRVGWVKIDKALRDNNEVVGHDQLVPLLRGDNRIEPHTFIAYAVRMGWLEIVP